MDEIKIPKARVAVLVGKKGETKKKIEKNTKTELKISKEGDVIIKGESIDVYVTKLIIKAIGRGFNPNIALKLLNEKNTLEVIDIKEYIGGSEKKIKRMKGRLIGTQGRAWKMLESKTNTDVSIFGKTIAIIGEIEDVNLARRAFEKLLGGAPHGKVYKFIEMELKRRRKEGGLNYKSA